MSNGRVQCICISPVAGERMQIVSEVEAIAGAGLKGDRYCTGSGSFSQNTLGKRQVTLINGIFFPNTGFNYTDSRRNIVTVGVELMWLIGREFRVGAALFRGVKYCEPCNRPNKFASVPWGFSFDEKFYDRGGLVAEIIEGGLIKVGDTVIPPPKGY
jgi:hypothetical protein